jgi:hypothetical protein
MIYRHFEHCKYQATAESNYVARRETQVSLKVSIVQL